MANTNLSLTEVLDLTPKTLSYFLKHQNIKNTIDERKQYELARFQLGYQLAPYSRQPLKISFPWDKKPVVDFDELFNTDFDELDKRKLVITGTFNPN